MVPRDLFNKMAALALVALILLVLVSFKAFALEEYYIDSGPPPDPGEREALGTLLGEVVLIRQMLELLLCFVIPFGCAAWLVYKFCMWFYYTFIRSVL